MVFSKRLKQQVLVLSALLLAASGCAITEDILFDNSDNWTEYGAHTQLDSGIVTKFYERNSPTQYDYRVVVFAEDGQICNEYLETQKPSSESGYRCDPFYQ